jgi:hypothetical protein
MHRKKQFAQEETLQSGNSIAYIIDYSDKIQFLVGGNTLYSFIFNTITVVEHMQVEYLFVS